MKGRRQGGLREEPAVVEGVQRRRIVHDGIHPAGVLLAGGHAKLRGFGLGPGPDLAADLADLATTLHHAVSGHETDRAPALATVLAALLGLDPAERAADSRLLDHLGTEPSVVYLKKVDPNASEAETGAAKR